MKKFVYLLCPLALACQREKAEPSGSVAGLLNKTDWATPGWSFELYSSRSAGIGGELCHFPTNDIMIQKRNPEGFTREDFFIAKIPLRIGEFKLEQIRPCRESDAIGAQFHLVGADGDVLRQVYLVLESENNRFFVDGYDEKGGRMRGRFQITFVVNPKMSSKIPPDTIRFTNGTFDVPITKK